MSQLVVKTACELWKLRSLKSNLLIRAMHFSISNYFIKHLWHMGSSKLLSSGFSEEVSACGS